MVLRDKRKQASEDARTVARVRNALEAQWSQGAESVPVAVMLDLLNPQGTWSREPERGRDDVTAPPPAPPGDVDPLTGCRSVSPGSLPACDPAIVRQTRSNRSISAGQMP